MNIQVVMHPWMGGTPGGPDCGVDMEVIATNPQTGAPFSRTFREEATVSEMVTFLHEVQTKNQAA